MRRFLWIICYATYMTYTAVQCEFFVTRELDRSGASLRRITIKHESGDVYVGGKNVVFHLDGNLREKSNTSIGPKRDSKQCAPNARNCVSARMTDNFVEVLEFIPSQEKILLCGTLRQGVCTFLNSRHISRKEKFLENIQNYIGSERSTIFVPYKAGSSDHYFIGRNLDGRNDNFYFPEFSFMKIHNRSNDEFSWEFQNYTLYSNIAVCHEKRGTSSPKFIYGFEHGKYVYSIYLLTRNSTNEQHYETKISRICKEDNYMSSFNEIIIDCDGHNIATSAYFSPDEMVLFVTFGIGAGSINITTNSSSAVCYFTVDQIQNRFKTLIIQCFNNEVGNSPPSWTNCTSTPTCKQAQIDPDNYCENLVQRFENRGVQSTQRPPRNMPVFEDKNIVFTLIFSQQHHSEMVIWIGTSDGHMIKVKNSTRKMYAKYDVSGSRNIKIEPAFALDANKTHVYLLHRNKISKFPLQSCEVHTNCGTCVTNEDPLLCGWCRDSCVKKSECQGTWYNNSCPPFLEKVIPTSGQTEGGTPLTIHGRNFGSPSATSVIVSIGPTPCNIINRTDSTIICITSSSKNGTFIVTVTIEDNSKSKHGFIISGESETGDVSFSYMMPALYAVTPLFGPQHGNTLITFTGENLDIGSDLKITLSGYQCPVVSKNRSILICKTEECHIVHQGELTIQNLKCSGCNKIDVTIDGINITQDENKFCYKTNPVFKNFTKRKVILSGGQNIDIQGQNFDSVNFQKLIFDFKEYDRRVENCERRSATFLRCKSPNLSTANMALPMQSDITVMLEEDDFYWTTFSGNQKYNITVYPDPQFDFLNSSLDKEILLEERILELRGKYINLALTPEDIHVKVEEVDCRIVSMSPTSLRCDISDAIHKHKLLHRGNILSIDVQAGNYQSHLGNMKFSHKARAHLSERKHVIVFISIGVCIVFILFFGCYMKINHIGPFKRKLLSHESTVVFYADNPIPSTSVRLLQPEQDPESTASARLNDYVRDLEGKTMMANGETSVANHVIGVVQETLMILEKQNLLIDGDCLRLGADLGRGNFGCVYKGFLKKPSENYEMIVAVKTIIRAGAIEVNAFLNEALIMKDFNHPNVLTMIGIIMDKGEFPMVVLPFMQNGALLSFIRDEQNKPTVKMLVTYGLDIALGMEYLSNIKFVHRDLAARNCMMDADFTVKVADFGLSRDVYSKQYYSSENKEKLPVKWMAPECLEQGKYSPKSDVWSYGVVLWELMTRGAIPYPEVDNWDMSIYLKTGRRLPRPDYCPIVLYKLMSKCWQDSPENRPTFNQLADRIARLLDEKDKSHMVSDARVDLEKCTTYHYMDHQSLSRQRSLSAKQSVSSEDSVFVT